MHANPMHRVLKMQTLERRLNLLHAEIGGLDEAHAHRRAARMGVAQRANPMHQPQALVEATASDLNLDDKSPSEKKRRESHFAAKDKRLKKREQLDEIEVVADTSATHAQAHLPGTPQREMGAPGHTTSEVAAEQQTDAAEPKSKWTKVKSKLHSVKSFLKRTPSLRLDEVVEAEDEEGMIAMSSLSHSAAAPKDEEVKLMTNPMAQHASSFRSKKKKKKKKLRGQSMLKNTAGPAEAAGGDEEGAQAVPANASRSSVKWRKRDSATRTAFEKLYSGDGRVNAALEALFHQSRTEDAERLSVVKVTLMLRKSARGTDLEGNLKIQLDLIQKSTVEGTTSISLPLFLDSIKHHCMLNADGVIAKWVELVVEAHFHRVAHLAEARHFSYQSSSDGSLLEVDRAELMGLHARGTINDMTWIASRGGESWFMFRNIPKTDADKAGVDGTTPSPVMKEEEATVTSEEDWYYRAFEDHTAVLGPVLLEHLAHWLRDGHFTPEHEVRHSSSSSFITIAEAVARLEGGGGGDPLDVVSSDDPPEYFYSAEGKRHGPFALSELKQWHAAGYFSDEFQVMRGMEGDPHSLAEALQLLGGGDDMWYYQNTNDPTAQMLGPVTLTSLGAWLAHAHFAPEHLVRRGVDGALIAISEAVAGEESLVPDSSPLLVEDWFYKAFEDPSVVAGPVSLEHLAHWLREGHFAPEHEVRHRLHAEGSFIAIAEAVAAHQSEWHSGGGAALKVK
jgi:hypothetical protein